MDGCGAHKLVADVTLVEHGRVVLTRYRDVTKYDRQRGWFLPDDYLAHLEHPADAAARIVRTQLGMEPPPLRLAEVESFGNGAWHLVFHFHGSVTKPPDLRHGDNVAEAAWFALDSLPPEADVAHGGWAAIDPAGSTSGIRSRDESGACGRRGLGAVAAPSDHRNGPMVFGNRLAAARRPSERTLLRKAYLRTAPAVISS
jgi:ADP-ribose pyrophosphatase YjhB (NUDIX family)